jgi:2-iminobutanoate/2-iminopropanoate deaminase
MQFLNTNKAPKAIGPYSQAIKVNGFLYTSGQIALKLNGKMVKNDIKKQTKQVFKNLKAILEFNKSKIEDIIKINIFLIDMDDFQVVNKIMEKIFGEHKPARSTIAVKSLPKNALIEIDLIAISK